MMRILPAFGGVLSGVFRRDTAAASGVATSGVVTSDIVTSDMDCLPHQRKIQGEGGAFARAALHADIARVFLDDAVGYRKSKTGTAILALRGRRLGGEKWIVDALNVFLRNARTGIRDAHAHEFAVQRGHVQDSAPGHRVLGIQEQIQKHLLQAPGVALNQRKVLRELGLHLDVSHLELVLEQRQRIGDHLVQTDFRQFRARGAGKVQQIIDNLRSAERLLGDFLEHPRFLRIRLQLLRQHLGVGGDYRQRRIHFVRHAGGQQSDGRKLVGLGELDFKFDPLRDVVHDYQPPYHVELAGYQRRHRNIHDARFAGGSRQPELIKIVDARILPNAVELLDEGGRKNLAQRTPHHLPTRLGIHDFHLRVPGFDAILQVHSHHADVDGFNNILVEIFEPLVLADLLLERGIQPPVLDGNADVSRQSLQQLHIFAGEEVALHSLAQSEEGDGFLPRVTGNVVVQIQASDGFLRGSIFTRQLVRIFEEDVPDSVLDSRLREERQVEAGDVGDAKRLRQFKARRVAVAEEDSDAVHQQCAC